MIARVGLRERLAHDATSFVLNADISDSASLAKSEQIQLWNVESILGLMMRGYAMVAM